MTVSVGPLPRKVKKPFKGAVYVNPLLTRHPSVEH